MNCDASAANPYLLKIMPGVYDLGSSSLSMRKYVDIEGAGENVTAIRSSAASISYLVGAVIGASNAELRFLTVSNIGAANMHIGILNTNSSPKIAHVTGIQNCRSLR